MIGEQIIGGLFVLTVSLAMVAWPRVFWHLHTFGWVKGGEPTEFSIAFLRAWGAVFVVGSTIFIVATLFGYQAGGRH